MNQATETASPFVYQETTVRTIIRGDKIWFIAKDICELLAIKNTSQATSTLNQNEKEIIITDTQGGEQGLLAVDESGLFTMLIRARKPQAKPFRHWLTHVVLPELSKTHGDILTWGRKHNGKN